MQIYVINGFPRSGKSSFVSFCLDELCGWGKEVSTVDFVKKLAKECGWDGKKTPKSRKFLSDLKDLLTEWDDIPYKEILKEKRIFEYGFEQFDMTADKAFLFIHCREPKEIDRIKNSIDGCNVYTLCIYADRADMPKVDNNSSDIEVYNYKYDFSIDNNESLEELKDKAIKFIIHLKKTYYSHK
jgi:hypothetical protein